MSLVGPHREWLYVESQVDDAEAQVHLIPGFEFGHFPVDGCTCDPEIRMMEDPVGPGEIPIWVHRSAIQRVPVPDYMPDDEPEGEGKAGPERR